MLQVSMLQGLQCLALLGCKAAAVRGFLEKEVKLDCGRNVFRSKMGMKGGLQGMLHLEVKELSPKPHARLMMSNGKPKTRLQERTSYKHWQVNPSKPNPKTQGKYKEK